VLTATGLVNGKWQCSTPYRINTPRTITKKFVTGDYVGDRYSKFGTHPSMGGFWANGWNITNFLFMPFLGTYPQVRQVNGFSHMMAQTTQTHARMCLFGFRWYCSPFKGSNPQNPNFGGMNRRFQAKLVKSKNMHIIKTTASILTKLCTVIKTIKRPLTNCLEIWHGVAVWQSPPWHSVRVVVTSTLAISAKTGNISFYLYPFQGNSQLTYRSVVTLIDWFICLVFIFKKIYCIEWQDNLLKTGNKTANINVNENKCGPTAALPNIRGALCSMPQSLADTHY